MSKIAIFIPDLFWSSIPYEGLTLWDYLRRNFNKCECDLLMFENDIRLKKVFDVRNRYKFEPELFKSTNPRIVGDWIDLFNATADYKLLLAPVHLFPKSRSPVDCLGIESLSKSFKCPVLTWDIGGSDILNCTHYSKYLCVKGPIWKEWFVQMGFPKENIFITGSPQYDYYSHAGKMMPGQVRPLSRSRFLNKYELNGCKKIILVAPSNPGSHKEQFQQNLKQLKELDNEAKKHDAKLIIKTYPHDYMFYDRSEFYNGVYHRIYTDGMPQYKILSAMLPTAEIVESQDHFSAIMYSDVLFNMSGSHIAWETYFSNCQSHAMNYKDKPYYGGARYLPPFIKLPDDNVNIHIEKVADMFQNRIASKNCSEYISKEFAHENILKVVEKII